MNGKGQNKLTRYYGLNPGLANRLVKAGYNTPKLIRAASAAALKRVPGIKQRDVNEIRKKVG